MAEKLTLEEWALYQRIRQTRNASSLIEELDRLTPAQRAQIKDSLPLLREQGNFGFHYRYIALVACLDLTPAQLAAELDQWSVRGLAQEKSVLNYVTQRLISRGEDWVRRFVAATLAKRRLVESVALLLDPLINAFHLPLPEEPQYWVGWMRDVSAPAHHCRWEQRFIAACATPNTFAVPSSDEPTVEQLSRRIRNLRAAEPTDDRALLRALLQVFERGDRVNAQRVALTWLEAFDLIHLLPTEQAQVIAAIPSSRSFFAKLAAEQLLAADLSDDALTDLALTILPRKEKGIKRALLKAIARIAAPSQELRENVQLIATEPDSTSAALARKLLEQWGEKPEKPELLGLWRPPAGRCPQPVDYTLVPSLPDLVLLLGQVKFGWEPSPDLQERILAALVAAAHAHGLEPVKEAIRSISPVFYSRSSLANLLEGLKREEAKPRPVKSGFLSFLVMQRSLDVFTRLGDLPCLLSTPTHTDFHITWEAFIQRADRYRNAGVELLPTDVAVALARLDRAGTPEDLTAFEQPIQGVAPDLATVIRHWRDHPARPATLNLPPSDHDKRAEHLTVQGDEPPTHELLGLRNGWSLPYTPIRHIPEEGAIFTLLPEHPARPAGILLSELARWNASPFLNCFEHLAATIDRFDPLTSFAFLLLASKSKTHERDHVAAMLLTAWDEQRLKADDFVSAWRNPSATVWELSVSRIVATLTLIADAGGLALIWPLLVAVAEDLAGQEKVPTATSTVLEAILLYLPEVQAANPHIELPHITALAARKGSSKAIKVAREITRATAQ